MNILKGAAVLAAGALVGLGHASAASVVSLVGDKDGFGGEVASPAPDGVLFGVNYDNTSNGDPDFHDAWGFEQLNGPFKSPISFTHTYDLPADAISASFTINVHGMGDGGRSWNIVFNDVVIGTITSAQSTLAQLLTFDVPIDLLTGSDLVTLAYQSNQIEGYGINFSELVINRATAPVPVPGALPLLASAFGGFGLFRRMRRR